jgi:B12-binding domain/radical SAM domain protein of rhizo-twelve system
MDVRIALINPPWSFDGSIYFGCREAHLPLELAYAERQLRDAGHEARVFDCHLLAMTTEELRAEIGDYRPEMIVVATAPTYLFWRCAPPELRVPLAAFRAVEKVAAIKVAVGPHGSATPRSALRKLDVDVVIIGECEQTLVRLAAGERDALPGIAYRDGDVIRVNGGPQAAVFVDAPPLAWPESYVGRHRHHHHRFDQPPMGPGAEVEASRGCPYHCTFCAKENFRDTYRRRQLPLLLAEIDALRTQAVEYIYFIDEIFLPDRRLLQALAEREMLFGVQTRIDLWKPAMIELLGRAGCVSIEAGVESVTAEGRDLLAKDCRISTEELADRLIQAKQHVAFVQGNLIGMSTDANAEVAEWRARLSEHGVWANEPVPLFPYPGSPDYRKLWGEADDHAWERAHEHYLKSYLQFSDLQDDHPLQLTELERFPAADG